jgi:hypothetical protein
MHYPERRNCLDCRGLFNYKHCWRYTQKIWMCTFLDYFFIVFHGSLVIFDLTGWAWRRTRRIHLITIGLTILSWFGLGIFYGWGYCPSTDLHWEVKRKLGETNLPNSYVKYYVDKLTGFTWDPLVVNAVVLILGLLAFALSCWLNLQDYKSHRHALWFIVEVTS